MAYLTPYSLSISYVENMKLKWIKKLFILFFLKYIINDYNIYKLLNKFNLHDLIQKVMLSSNDFPNIKIKRENIQM